MKIWILDCGHMDFWDFGIFGLKEIRIPMQRDTNPDGMEYKSQWYGIRVPMDWDTNPNETGYESQ